MFTYVTPLNIDSVMPGTKLKNYINRLNKKIDIPTTNAKLLKIQPNDFSQIKFNILNIRF